MHFCQQQQRYSGMAQTVHRNTGYICSLHARLHMGRSTHEGEAASALRTGFWPFDLTQGQNDGGVSECHHTDSSPTQPTCDQAQAWTGFAAGFPRCALDRLFALLRMTVGIRDKWESASGNIRLPAPLRVGFWWLSLQGEKRLAYASRWWCHLGQGLAPLLALQARSSGSEPLLRSK